MDFISMLQNDPQARDRMNALLGRPAGSPAATGFGQGFGFTPPPAAGQPTGQPAPNPSGEPAGELSGMPAGQWNPEGQLAKHPNYNPYMGDPFSYGLAGGEHDFFGGGKGGAAGPATPAPAPVAQKPQIDIPKEFIPPAPPGFIYDEKKRVYVTDPSQQDWDSGE